MADDRDDFSRLNTVDELIVELQREMISGAHHDALERDRQSREFADVKRTIEMAKLEPPKGASVETKVKFIVSIVGGVIVFVIGAAIQNGWLSTPKAKDPGEQPIPVSTYELPTPAPSKPK